MLVYFLYYMGYAFIGWIIESLFRSITEKRYFINSGFLQGPFIPVYGYGALLILLFQIEFSSLNLLIRLIFFVISTTILEYFTSYILEKIFKVRLWDYSNMWFNINGRVCLLFSGFWALLSIVVIRSIQPLFIILMSNLSLEHRYYITIILLTYIFMDSIYSFRVYYDFSKILQGIKSKKISLYSTIFKEKLVVKKPIAMAFRLLRPLRAFPYLRKEFSSSAKRLSEDLFKMVYKDLHLDLPYTEIREYKEEEIMEGSEFYQICKGIIYSKSFQTLKDIKHHDKSIYHHNIKVAKASYIVAKRFNLHVDQMVRGALLHDFFFYDWRVKGACSSRIPHGFSHPKISFVNAEKEFGELSPIERDIILKHMWPITLIPPRYPESIIVSFLDKIVASKEFIIKDRSNSV